MATKFKLKKHNGKEKEQDSCKIDSDSKDRCLKFLTKAKLAMYMKRGLDIRDAAKLCNVSEYQLGILRSDPEFEEFIDFCTVNCELNHVSNIETAGSLGQWQASAWLLERKFPEKYGKKDTVKHEYEIKLLSFQKVVLNVINELEPSMRQLIMQKLRNVNVENEINQIEMGDGSLIASLGGK
jgi:hypothetical protein